MLYMSGAQPCLGMEVVNNGSLCKSLRMTRDPELQLFILQSWEKGRLGFKPKTWQVPEPEFFTHTLPTFI